MSRRIAVKCVLLISLVSGVMVAGPSPAEATGDCFRTVRDTGVRCTQAGYSFEVAVVALTNNEQMWPGAIESSTRMRRENTTYQGTGTVRDYYRTHTHAAVSRRWFCSSGTYKEIDYTASPKTRCLVWAGQYFGGMLVASTNSWTGKTFSGHVSTNPC